MSTDTLDENCRRWLDELHKMDEEIAELESRKGEFRQDTHQIRELKNRRAIVLSHLEGHGFDDQ